MKSRHLLVAAATLVLAIYLYGRHYRKALFPAQDVGIIQGISQAPESISFHAMVRSSNSKLARVISSGPGSCKPVFLYWGRWDKMRPLNSGRIQINLKPFARAPTVGADSGNRSAFQSKLAESGRPYISIYNPCRTLQSTTAPSRNQFQYTRWKMPIRRNWTHGTERMVAELQKAVGAQGCCYRSTTSRASREILSSTRATSVRA